MNKIRANVDLNRSRVIFFSALLFLSTFVQAKEDLLVPYDGPSLESIDRDSLLGKVMCGYQGWFNCEGDGSGLGWTHWARSRSKLFEPGNITVDLWPDVSEYDDDELYETGFQNEDGSFAKVFSSHHRKTVMRHFSWMRDYGIDGAFVQRFAHGLRREDMKYHKNKVLSSAREGANRLGRTYAVMYDLTGIEDGDLLEVVGADWYELRTKMKITEDPAYLHHKGKPVVALWGIGFNEEIKPRAEVAESAALIDYFKRDGNTVMLGTPTGWREQVRDASEDPELHAMLQKADVISPWSVTRYQSVEGAHQHQKTFWGPDHQWCKERGMDYLPVIYPGFSWHNNKGGPLGRIPRLKGNFMWQQALAAKRGGAEMIYIAMFDEVDEGTAIFKCTNNPPMGNGGNFLTYEGLPSDYYLKLAGKIGELIRGEIPLTEEIPPLD